MTHSLPQSIIDRIAKRFDGCDTVGMKRSEFDLLANYIAHLEERVSALPPEPEQYEPVDTAQSKPGEVSLQFARIARLRAGDELAVEYMK